MRIPKGSDLGLRLMRALDRTGLDEPTLVLRCVEAAVEYIERHGSITLPLSLVPKSESPLKIVRGGITQSNVAYGDGDDEIRAAKVADKQSKPKK